MLRGKLTSQGEKKDGNSLDKLKSSPGERQRQRGRETEREIERQENSVIGVKKLFPLCSTTR
jgi:hypothetical protein